MGVLGSHNIRGALRVWHIHRQSGLLMTWPGWMHEGNLEGSIHGKTWIKCVGPCSALTQTILVPLELMGRSRCKFKDNTSSPRSQQVPWYSIYISYIILIYIYVYIYNNVAWLVMYIYIYRYIYIEIYIYIDIYIYRYIYIYIM